MHCDIYKASTRDELYVYIARPNYPDDADGMLDPMACLPADLRQGLGRPKFVMHLDLASITHLARVPIKTVLASLEQQQFFVQFPPDGLISATAPAPEGLRGA